MVERLRDIPGIGVDKVGAAADAQSDPTMLRLENLDTDIAPPPAALQATREAIGRDDANSYLPFLGIEPLRRAAAERVSLTAGVAYDWQSECIVSAGGLAGILTVLLAILDRGDEVIITDPAYAGLINRIRLAEGVPRFVPLKVVDGGWRLDLTALQEAASPRTKAILTMSPSMPSGIVHTQEEWRAIAEVADRTGAWVVHDAAMERILFDGAIMHPAHFGLAERTITIGSLSKEYRMIGWRVGWVVGPRAIMDAVGLVSLTNVVCQVGIAMPGAAAALTASDDGVDAATQTLKQRRDMILSQLADLPVVRPDGGWSLLVDTVSLGLSPQEASHLSFERGRIAATPMTGWGAQERAGRYLRFVFANEPVDRLSDIRERLRRSWNV
ncbi:MAG: pyridoxal phosphate-dependent aminotransferase [Devosia sp.]